MKFLLQLIVVSSLALSPLYAGIKYTGTEVNNGGAGISINGKVATFYSAELQISPEPLKRTLTMSATANLISKMELPKRVTIELVENLLPSFDRKYYAVKAESLDQGTIEFIKKQYSKITNQPVENITIFALTDSANKITLLLPDFFKLNDSEQMAILFHESLWINERVKSYEHMIEIEKDTQIFAMYPDDCSPRYNLTKRIENIFNEKLWALNAIFGCQTQKYFSYTAAPSVPLNDFISRDEATTLAEILLRTSLKMPVSNQLYELFLNQIKKNLNYKMFLSSKLALIEALRDPSINTSIIVYGTPLPYDPIPLSQNNINILAQNLSTARLMYGFLDFDFFNMTILNSFTSAHMQIDMTYDPNNKGNNKVTE